MILEFKSDYEKGNKCICHKNQKTSIHYANHDNISLIDFYYLK